MKIRMIVIDDEMLVRKGVISSVDWEREGIEIAGEAADGRSGLELIRKVKPHLVLTDIKMPHMDGLEMIKRVRAEDPQIRFVILSVLEDFQTVREALKLGAVDYMNKFLMEPDELLHSVLKIKETIVPHESVPRISDSDVLPRRIMMNGDWMEWLKGERHEEYDRAFEQGGGSYAVIVLEAQEARTGIRSEADDARTALEQAIESETEIECLFMYEGHSGWVLLCRSCYAAHDEMQPAPLFLQRLLEWQSACRGAFSAGISQTFTGAAERMEAYRQALSALRLVFYRGNGVYLHTAGLLESSGPPPRFLELAALKHYLLQLEGYDDEIAFKAFHDLFPENLIETVEEAAVTDAVHAWVSSVILLLKDWGGQVPVSMQKESLFEQVHSRGTYSELRQWCYHLHQLVREMLTELKATQHRPEIQRAMDYIKAHYQELIRVQDVALYVNLSENYFSNLFTKEAGKTFSQYVQEIRVEKAKELLRGGKLEWFEVGELVGMDNPKYFSKVFKKYTGCTPVRYTSSQK
ncbi:MAG: two component transcriptional regulator, AraC family [Paenibacillus sp.]|jgi:two-component system response regulator YesN|nr:two component transcriptional regulator, AraC family [Paenibacillus sp.]